MKRRRLNESIVGSLRLEAAGQAPSRASIVLIRAGLSLNGTLYPPGVLAAAAPLYEGARCMLNHPGWEYDIEKLAGVITDVQWDEEGQALTGALNFLDTPAGQTLRALAQHEARLRQDGALEPDKRLFGFSHVVMASGEYADYEGTEEQVFKVDRIVEVLSVDAVVFPAAGGEVRAMMEALQKEERMEKEERRQVSLEGITLEGVSPEQARQIAEQAAERAYQAVAEQYRERVQALEVEVAELQTRLQEAQAERDLLRAEAERRQRAEAIERLFSEAALPEEARLALREQVMELPLGMAESIIKAMALSLRPVSGSQDDLPQRESKSLSPLEAAEREGEEFAKALLGK